MVSTRVAAIRLQELLSLRLKPATITFSDEPPTGCQRVTTPAPASCAYWREAAEGKTFYTTSADHRGCPIGAHTHRVDLPDEGAELNTMIRDMVALEYIQEHEVAAIPQRETPFRYAVYAPLGESQIEPDIVLVRARTHQLMLLAEAARAANIASEAPTLGRPTCAVVPQTLNSHATSSSFGCIGNRVYTGASESEGYFAIPGALLAQIVEKLEKIVVANAELEKFHRRRLPIDGPSN
jgi:uncharacterized protein (DUF169 family)